VNEYGATIRKIRQEKGLTLKTLAERTGLSVGFLSKVERGASNLSFANVQKICYALGVTPSVFEHREAVDEKSRKFFFIPKHGRGLIYAYDSGVKMESVMMEQDKFHVCVMTLAKDSSTRSVCRHSANEFGIVMQGTLRIVMNDEEYILHPEDAMLIPAQTEHSVEKLGGKECVSVWIKYE